MVEWGGLENRCRLRSTVGSNPTLPAETLNVQTFNVKRLERSHSWSSARDWKSRRCNSLEGSNPSLSALLSRVVVSSQKISSLTTGY